jgi:hypothetical protein
MYSKNLINMQRLEIKEEKRWNFYAIKLAKKTSS